MVSDELIDVGDASLMGLLRVIKFQKVSKKRSADHGSHERAERNLRYLKKSLEGKWWFVSRFWKERSKDFF